MQPGCTGQGASGRPNRILLLTPWIPAAATGPGVQSRGPSAPPLPSLPGAHLLDALERAAFPFTPWSPAACRFRSTAPAKQTAACSPAAGARPSARTRCSGPACFPAGVRRLAQGCRVPRRRAARRAPSLCGMSGRDGGAACRCVGWSPACRARRRWSRCSGRPRSRAAAGSGPASAAAARRARAATRGSLRRAARGGFRRARRHGSRSRPRPRRRRRRDCRRQPRARSRAARRPPPPQSPTPRPSRPQ
eukprot:240945-Chlamydomonas_euryale.AAC.2